MKILIVDNYDSFTYNLYHLLEDKVASVDVIRNDNLNFDTIKNYDKIVLSPGPGIPSEASLLKPLVQEFASIKSILGICLGHQAIGEVMRCKLLKMRDVKHGTYSYITDFDTEDYLFKGIEKPFKVGHYHSWVVDEKTMGDSINCIAKSEDFVMGLTHNKFDLKGLQFHPESILTPQGNKILQNWLNY